MKLIAQKLWMLIAMLCVSISANAYDFEVDGVRYAITSFVDLTVTAESLSNDAAGILTLPVSVTFKGKKLKVSAIGSNFAYGNNKLTKIKIESLLSGGIGNGAFSNCRKLENVTIASCVSLGDSAFMKSTMLETVSLPEDLISIAPKSFAYCTSLKQISLPTSLEKLGEYAFSGCSSLVECNMSQLSEIPDGTFSDCSSLTSISIPSSVRRIGEDAFNGCTSLNGVELPDSLIYIFPRAFRDCKLFSEFYIPNSVVYIGYSALLGCENIKTISIGSGIEKLVSLWGCERLENLIFRETDKVLEISGDSGEYYYDRRKGVNMYYGLFKNLRVTSLVIKSPVTYVDYYSWDNSKESFYRYYISPFEYNPYLRQVICSGYFQMKGNSEIHTGTYKGNTKYNTDAKECIKYTNCANLKQVYLDSCVKEIPDTCFKGAHSLESIIMTGVDSVKRDAFLDCPDLKEIEFPNTIKSISNSISSCKLSKIVIKSLQPPTADGFSNDMYLNCRLIVPASCINVYQKAYPWNNFWNMEGCDFSDSGVEKAKIEDSSISLIAENGSIRVLNKEDGDVVRVYSVNGTKVAETSESMVTNLHKGAYIVTIGSKTYKVLVR